MAEISEGKRNLVGVWQDIQRRISEKRPSQRQGTARKFVEYAWESFDVGEVTNILALPGDSYFAHKDVLYEGLCAWVACPGNRNLPRHGMVLRSALHLDAAEKYGREQFENIGQVGDIYIRAQLIGPEFFEEIYYPIGGILRISKSLSRAGYRAKLYEKSRGLLHAIRVAKIYHYHVDCLMSEKTYRKPSLNAAAGLVSDIDPEGDKLPGERMIKQYWSDYRRSVAIGYAAYSIDLSGGTNLLNSILSGRSTWRAHRKIFPLWMGRARYVADHILGRCAETETSSMTLQMLPNVPLENFNCPAFSEHQANNIRKKFKSK